MLSLRRLTTVVVAMLLAVVVTPWGTDLATAQRGTPTSPDEIEVTPVNGPQGVHGGGYRWRINERGEVAFMTAIILADAYMWRDGDSTRINPEGVQVHVRGLSDRGRVVGDAYDSGLGQPAAPFSWAKGVWEILPTGEASGGLGLDVNDRGTVAGVLQTAPGGTQELVAWDDGELVMPPTEVRLSSLLFPGEDDDPVQINRRNQVAFTGRIDGGTQQAGIWDIDAGEVIGLGTLGGESSWMGDINNQGQVVGTSYASGSALRAFLWDDGEMTNLGTLGGDSQAVALNDHGQVAGYFDDVDGVVHSFLWEDGEMTEIPSFGGADSRSRPYDINRWGQVVGFSGTAGGPQQAYLWQDGQLVNLGELADPVSASSAIDINNRGQVIGFALDSDVGYGFLWTLP